MKTLRTLVARMLPVVFALMLLAPTTEAGFYRLPASAFVGRVWLSTDERIALRFQLVDTHVLLVSFDPFSGKRLGQLAIPELPNDLGIARVGDADRIVVLHSQFRGPNAAIVDLARDGRLGLRADVSLPDVTAIGALFVSANGAFYVETLGGGQRFVSYSLDSGQRLGSSPLWRSGGNAVTLIDDARPRIIYTTHYNGPSSTPWPTRPLSTLRTCPRRSSTPWRSSSRPCVAEVSAWERLSRACRTSPTWSPSRTGCALPSRRSSSETPRAAAGPGTSPLSSTLGS